MQSAHEIRANFQDQSGELMQIREITRRLNEGAFGAGFAQGAGISVPDIKDPSNALTAYGDARLKAAAAAARPAIALAAKQEMQAWNMALADLLKKEKVIDRNQLSDTSKSELARDLDVRLHRVLMQGNVGSNYVQDLPARVDQLSQPKAKVLIDQLNAAKQDILNFDQSATAQQQLAQWQTLSQTAYEAMALAQFYPDAKLTPATMPELLNNPGGGYNIGDSLEGRLGSGPADTAITDKIQAELKATPGRMPVLKSNSDGSVNIGSQRLDPRDPIEAAAIKRIMSTVAKPGAKPGARPTAPPPPDAAGNTISSGGIVIPAGARTAESTKKKKNVLVNQAYKSKYQK
jgi:hypothetical protein